MEIKTINLATLHNESEEIREAIAFYTGFTVFPMQCTSADRERHYGVLEQAGYIEKVGGINVY